MILKAEVEGVGISLWSLWGVRFCRGEGGTPICSLERSFWVWCGGGISSRARREARKLSKWMILAIQMRNNKNLEYRWEEERSLELGGQLEVGGEEREESLRTNRLLAGWVLGLLLKT